MKFLRLYVMVVLLLIPMLSYSQVSVSGSLYPSYFLNVDEVSFESSTFNVEGFVSANYLGDKVNALIEANTTTTDIDLYQATIRLNFNVKRGILGTVYAGKIENPWQGVYRNNMYHLNRSNTAGLLPVSFIGVGVGTTSPYVNADVMVGNVDTTKTLFAQVNLSKGSMSGGLFLNQDLGSDVENPYFGGKIEFKNVRIDMLIESIMKSVEEGSLKQSTRGIVAYNIPKTNFGLFGEFLNTNFNEKTSFGVTGALYYNYEDLNVAIGWNGYKNDIADEVMTNLVFFSAGYLF